ncbi:hypothetical protein MKW92_045930 [Papaver armeniacum]|nr:hypothetical protein MKW92_045930 [Papaver armeniacum]
MEDQKKKKKKNLTRGKRKMEMDDVRIVYNKKRKMNIWSRAAESLRRKHLPNEVILIEYKIVIVYSNSSPLLNVIVVHDKFKCMVFPLGSKPWRESSSPNTLPVITTSAGIIQERVIMSRMSFSRSAIYVNGALLLHWRVHTRDGVGGGGIGDDDEDQEIYRNVVVL